MRFAFGRFYGTQRQRAEVAGIGLSETVYDAHARLPVHSHDSPYFCFVLRGGFAESFGRRERLCRPAMLIYHPAGEAHADRFGEAGGACFNFELGAAWAERMRAASLRLDEPAAFTDHATAGLAVRLRSEFYLHDDLSPLAIESLTLEILVTAARKRVDESAPRSPPLWLKQAEELIRVRFTEPPTLHEIAATVHRHPVHLSREFRRHYGCTIGGYVRDLRLDAACRRLATTAEPLVMIALACGFAGQAHFCDCFKRAKGISPRQYRDAFRGR